MSPEEGARWKLCNATHDNPPPTAKPSRRMRRSGTRQSSDHSVAFRSNLPDDSAPPRCHDVIGNSAATRQQGHDERDEAPHEKPVSGAASAPDRSSESVQ